MIHQNLVCRITTLIWIIRGQRQLALPGQKLLRYCKGLFWRKIKARSTGAGFFAHLTNLQEWWILAVSINKFLGDYPKFVHLTYDGGLRGIFHFFIYFHIAVLLKPTWRLTSALFQSHSSRSLSKVSRESFFRDEEVLSG